MGLEGIDLPAVGGGLSLIGALLFVLRIAFARLERQDDTWVQLLNAAERRAESAEATLAELRRSVTADKEANDKFRQESSDELRNLKTELEQAQLQIQELQHWNGEKR